MIKENYIEKYIKQMENHQWQLKNKDNENLIFEKDKSQGKYFKTFMRNSLSINFTNFMIILICIINIYRNYKEDFCYIATSYWRIFILYFCIMSILMILIEFIREIRYLFKYRVDVSQEKSLYKVSIDSVKKRRKGEKIELIVLTILLILGLVTTIGANTLLKEDISKDNLNLKLTDLNDKLEGNLDSNLDRRKTIFAEYIDFNQIVYDNVDKTYYTERREKAYLDVEYFTSDYQWILEKGFRGIYSELSDYTKLKESSNAKELKNFGAKKIFIGENKEHIIVYEDAILSIDGDIEYTKENINRILKTCK